MACTNHQLHCTPTAVVSSVQPPTAFKRPQQTPWVVGAASVMCRALQQPHVAHHTSIHPQSPQHVWQPHKQLSRPPTASCASSLNSAATAVAQNSRSLRLPSPRHIRASASAPALHPLSETTCDAQLDLPERFSMHWTAQRGSTLLSDDAVGDYGPADNDTGAASVDPQLGASQQQEQTADAERANVVELDSSSGRQQQMPSTTQPASALNAAAHANHATAIRSHNPINTNSNHMRSAGQTGDFEMNISNGSVSSRSGTDVMHGSVSSLGAVNVNCSSSSGEVSSSSGNGLINSNGTSNINITSIAGVSGRQDDNQSDGEAAPAAAVSAGSNGKPLKYTRIMLKISGEALQGRQGFGLDKQVLQQIAEEIQAAHNAGVGVAVVVGGGNFARGVQLAQDHHLDRATADYVGMLATIMNSLCLQGALEALGVPTRVQSAIEMREVAEPYVRRRAIVHLESRKVVIFGAGTGNPFFSTDTAAALRAAEMNAQVFMKATKVDGVYDSDPLTNSNACRFTELSYDDVSRQQLHVMDETAVTLCKENSIPVIVFDVMGRGNVLRAAQGEQVGTSVSKLHERGP